jgi:hypothetical protein
MLSLTALLFAIAQASSSFLWNKQLDRPGSFFYGQQGVSSAANPYKAAESPAYGFDKSTGKMYLFGGYASNSSSDGVEASL